MLVEEDLGQLGPAVLDFIYMYCRVITIEG